MGFSELYQDDEASSGGQRLVPSGKQGNTLLRYLWCEAAMHAVERDPELKRFYRRKLVQKGLGKAKVAAAGSWNPTGSLLRRPD